MLRDEILKDPYPVFKRLRADAALSRLHPEGPWLIARHADVLSVLKNSDLFRSARPNAKMALSEAENLLVTRSLVGADGDQHARLRRVIREGFAPARMLALESKIRRLVQTRLRSLGTLDDFDFVAKLAQPLPLEVIALLMGVPRDCVGQFADWVDLLVTWGSPDCRFSESEALERAQAMLDFFEREISDRATPTEDNLISFLSLRVEEKSSGLAARELIGFLRLLLVAGSETTTHLLGNTALALVSQAGLWNLLQTDLSLVAKLIEESLRYDSPVPSLIRWASDDTEIYGETIRKGEAVMPLLASANHDAAVFPDPESFKLDRVGGAHLSFGAGSHFCMGIMLARLQSRIVFEEALRAFSALELASDRPIERVESFFVRGPVELTLKARSR